MIQFLFGVLPFFDDIHQPIETFDFSLYLPPELNCSPAHVLAIQYDDCFAFLIDSELENFDVNLSVNQLPPYCGMTSNANVVDNHVSFDFNWWLT